MARVAVLQEAVLEFSYDAEFGAYANHGCTLHLTEGELYTVLFDDAEYSCIAFPANVLVPTNNLGNPMAFGGEDNGMPFVIASNVENGGTSIFTFDASTTHTISVYQETSEEGGDEGAIDPNDVVLKGYSGTDNRYENVPKVWLTSADGESKVPFSYGEAVDDVPVVLDFSNGDQTIIAPDGTLVRSAIIAQPENLVSENIKIGETVAGIPGSFIGEGEAITIELDLSRGNQVVLPVSDGKLLSQVTIIKPETLVEENIAKGVVIAGLSGSFIGNTEEATVDLNLLNGDQIVEPSDEGKVLSKIIIRKPDTLVPENIAVGIIIGGVEGTHEGGGGDGGDLAAFITRTITEYSGDIASVGDYAFHSCKSLAKVDVPNLTKIGLYGFYNCSALTEINAPNLYELSNYAFYGCTSLKQVDVSKVHSVGAYAFGQCKGITTLDFGTSIDSQIGSSAFNTGAAVNIIIRNTTMIPDASSQYGYLFGMTTQRLFVPRSMVSTWKASNYMKAYHSNQVYAIEDYPSICG